MEQLAQYGIAGAALAAVIAVLTVVLRFVLPSMVKTTTDAWAKQMTAQHKMHAEENAATRTAFIDALGKQQTVFRETLTEERKDCAARHDEVMSGIESLHDKINRISPMPVGK